MAATVSPSSIARRHARASRSVSAARRSGGVYFNSSGLDMKYQQAVQRSFSNVRVTVENAGDKFRRTRHERIEPPRSSAYHVTSNPGVLNPTSFNPSPYGPSKSTEEQPLRKYDVYSLRTWSYPIWSYLNKADHVPYSLSTAYAPPPVTPDFPKAQNRHAYSTYSYVSAEHSYQLTDTLRYPLTHTKWSRRENAHSKTPWYQEYRGQAGLRNFGGFRPRNTLYKSSPLWQKPVSHYG